MAFDPITAGLDLARTLIDAIVSRIPDPAERERERARLEAAAQAADQAQTMAQIEVNKTEAASGSVFVAGWRPFIGWTCGAALAYQYVGAPLASFCMGVAGLDVPPLPRLDDGLWQLVAGMLGLGAMRSYEKVQGAETTTIRPYVIGGGRGR
jgi:hypothetical protein